MNLSHIVEALQREGEAAMMVGPDAEITGIEVDSRKVAAGDLFVCKGAGFRPAFLTAAAEAGAAAYLCQGETADDGALTLPAELAAAAHVPAIVAGDVRRAMAIAAAEVFNHPDQRVACLGITGTKGKTTTAFMLRGILETAGYPTSMLGSVETDDGVERFESVNTTPEAPELWRHLHNTEASGRKYMVMEVSSQGLKYDRVLGLNLRIGCFLNIARDHISPAEHPTFEDYFASKLRIFDQCETAVVNLDAQGAAEALASASHASELLTFSVSEPSATYHAGKIACTQGAIVFDAYEAGDPRPHPIALGIAGSFNVSNALCAIACARRLGISWAPIAAALARCRVPGRMEVVAPAHEPITAIVDYAHNELSFETLFSSVKQEYPGQRIISIFGAPGGKAYERREVLPQVAGKYSNLIIYAEEDPANDPVEEICAQLVSNTPAGVAREVVIDREDAFKRAVAVARGWAEPTVILFLAKGKEELQHRGNEFVPIKSDSQIAHEVLNA